jgi:hypothetical protein
MQAFHVPQNAASKMLNFKGFWGGLDIFYGLRMTRIVNPGRIFAFGRAIRRQVSELQLLIDHCQLTILQ